MSYAGSVCGKCGKGFIGACIRVSDEWERRIRNKYVSCCDDCKRKILLAAIARGAALPWDLPGHEHTNANNPQSP